MNMMWIVVVFASAITLFIIALGFIMMNPESVKKMSVFEDTASEGVKTGKSLVNDASKLNASSIVDPIVDKKDEVIATIMNDNRTQTR